MSDKKVYAWAVRDAYDKKYSIQLEHLNYIFDTEYPLYSIEEVQYVIENNELPKHPVMYVVWDDSDSYKSVVLNLLSYKFNNEVPVYSADELLAELQKEI